jgi:UDP-glucose 4-epimerase
MCGIVWESNVRPLEYYAQNVSGSIELLKAMQRHNCHQIVFSSSATVYGEATYLPYDEQHPLQPKNPYGRTKYFIEEIIRDWATSQKGVSAILLRYFNPVGADAFGRIGEDPNGIPNNLVPYISQVALGRLQHLNVFGADYETRDGTGERDYIHVEDLARAHLAAIKYSSTSTGCEAINVGTGRGATVLEMVKAFEQASGQKVPYKIGPRRDGDVARSIAAVDKAERLLGWTAKLDLADMCKTTWNWYSSNPNGYNQ